MANTYELISSVTVGSGGAATMAFTSIPSTYTDLVVISSCRNTSTGGANISMTFNGSSTGYTTKILEGDGSTVVSASGTYANAGLIVYSNQTSNTFSNNQVYIPNYASSNYKSFSTDGVQENNATLAYSDLVAGLWSNTAAITSITLTPTANNFAEHSTAYLYGISNA